MTLDSNVDSGESVVTSWSGPRAIPGERYSVTDASGSVGSYTGSLTISPLADQDDGTYTCTVIVTGGGNVRQATASDDIIITVTGKEVYLSYSQTFTYEDINMTQSSIYSNH